ncbi:uncharacterized protein LOC144115516 isoform X2 [Amblyomma americanum]
MPESTAFERTTGGGLPNPEAVLSPSDARILGIVGEDCSVGCRSPAVFGMAPAAAVSPAPSPAPQASQVVDEHDYCSVQGKHTEITHMQRTRTSHVR